MFEELKRYISAINIHEDIYYIQLNIPTTWEIKNFSSRVSFDTFNGDIEALYGISPSVTMDEILLELKEIVDYNIAIEAKEALLGTKIKELKQLFTVHSIDDLMGLKFVLGGIETKIETNKDDESKLSIQTSEKLEPKSIDSPKEVNLPNIPKETFEESQLLYDVDDEIRPVGVEVSAEDMEHITLEDLKRRG